MFLKSIVAELNTFFHFLFQLRMRMRRRRCCFPMATVRTCPVPQNDAYNRGGGLLGLVVIYLITSFNYSCLSLVWYKREDVRNIRASESFYVMNMCYLVSTCCTAYIGTRKDHQTPEA